MNKCWRSLRSFQAHVFWSNRMFTLHAVRSVRFFLSQTFSLFKRIQKNWRSIRADFPPCPLLLGVFVFFMFLPTASKCLHQDSERSGFWRPVGSGRTENRFSRFQLNTDQQGNGDKIYVLDESKRFDRRQRRSSSCRLLPAQTFNMWPSNFTL